jgi:hypothetical protein
MTVSKITRKHIVLMVASGWLAMTALGAIDWRQPLACRPPNKPEIRGRPKDRRSKKS